MDFSGRDMTRYSKLVQINLRSRLFAIYLRKLPLGELGFEAVTLILVLASAHKKFVVAGYAELVTISGCAPTEWTAWATLNEVSFNAT